MSGNTLRKSGAWRIAAQARPGVVRPQNDRELRACLAPSPHHATPVRPMGAGSSSTDCTSATAGTVIDLSAMNRIRDIDLHDYTVTVQPGVTIRALSDELAAQGLELEGSHDLMNRTVGGAVASGCIGPSIGDDGSLFASQLCAARVITPNGGMLTVGPEKENLLSALRLSYGMLGVFSELTLRIRPVRHFEARHRRCTIAQFSAAAEKLARTNIGVRFCLMPFRDRVYLDLRRYNDETSNSSRLPWRLKDWGESTVLPHVFKSLNRIVPVAGVRYRLIDELSSITQGLVNNRLVGRGSSSATLTVGGRPQHLNYSTWFFPAADFAIVVQAYRKFCLRVHEENGFRCDMPTMGFRLRRDQSALLSPLFDEPMIALRAVSTQSAGWEDFAIDFGEFAEHWGGVPLFNQSRSLSPDHARQVFGERLEFFRKMRRRLDPEDRMMNPFLSQYFL
ncbi:MAG: FAD-binding oxidoreductase [Woeseiaceae bacterium]|nr:FAD-binding oxidoreductase [Woeseiaceae bacterium]